MKATKLFVMLSALLMAFLGCTKEAAPEEPVSVEATAPAEDLDAPAAPEAPAVLEDPAPEEKAPKKSSKKAKKVKSGAAKSGATKKK